MTNQKTIEVLQFFVDGLTNGANAHMLQGKVFGALGFSKLAEKYKAHYDEEMGWVSQFLDRIADLGGETKLGAQEPIAVVKNPVAYLEMELKAQAEGVALLRKCMGEIADDYTTLDILKAYLKDEEEDLYWMEAQKELIGLIGEQNWLLQQL